MSDNWLLDGAPDEYSQPYDGEGMGPFEYPITNEEWCSAELVLPEEKKSRFGNVYFRRLIYLMIGLWFSYVFGMMFLWGVCAMYWFKFIALPGFYLYQDYRMVAASGSNTIIKVEEVSRGLAS